FRYSCVSFFPTRRSSDLCFGEVVEQPGASEAAAPHDDSGAIGVFDHPHRVGGFPDIAVTQHGNIDGGNQLGDGVPVGVSRVVLSGCAAVQSDGGTSAVLG